MIGTHRLGRNYWFLFILASVFMPLVMIKVTQADVVWLKNQAGPKFGRIRSLTDSALTFDEWQSDSKQFSVREIPRSEVDAWVQNIQVSRLELLHPDRPDEYAAYCEELAGQSSDPVAADLAVRLALIVSAHADAQVRDSGLRLLVAVARTDSERLRFGQLASLYGLAIVEPEKTVDPNPMVASDSALLRLVVALRQGRRDIASDLMRTSSPELDQQLKAIGSALGLMEFRRLSDLQQLPKRSLADLVRLEVCLRSRAPQVSLIENNWATQAGADWGEHLSIPQLETITEFNPAASIFRNGEWLDPRTEKAKNYSESN